MKTLQGFAIVGLFASMSLIAASCVPDTTEPEDEDPGVSEGAEGTAEEDLSEPDVDPEIIAACRPVGYACYRDYQCCSGQCAYGRCRYWGQGCRPVGYSCYSDHQCCSGECFHGVCRVW